MKTSQYTTEMYQTKMRPDETVNAKTRAARAVKVCEIVGCESGTYRGNSTKCKEHRGHCGYENCDRSSWAVGGSSVLNKAPNGKTYNYKNGKDYRYCEMHKGRVRNQRRMDAKKGHAKSVVTLEEDGIDLSKPYSEWRLHQGYRVRSAYTFAERLITQFEHRVVVEESLGRYLSPVENVHHKNGLTTDNRLKNLEVFDYAQPIGQRVEDLLDWCVEYLYEREMMVEEWIFPSQSLLGWKAAFHRIVVGSKLGRPLESYERVYFADRDKRNLDISNLELWTSSKPKSYEEHDIVAWMRDVFLPDFGYRVVTLSGNPVS